nr:hypothetical protein CACDSRKY_CACDSRKY_CDS_0020 [Caudoviricetes sp.]
MNAELVSIVNELEFKAGYEKLHFNYLKSSMYENWIDQIKNCEVGLKEARQMLRASKLK